MEDFKEAGETQDILETWRTKGPDANLATQICNVLKAGHHFAELEKFVAELPEASEYQAEEIIRSKIAIAWMRRNCELVYELIKENSFSNGEDLIEIWDKAHYYQEEQKKGKTLTALAKFRVRQKFIPPYSICPSGVRKKNTLPKEAKQVLNAWLDKNMNDPFPNRNTQVSLAHETGLTKPQVKTWFANARRRLYESKPKRAARYKIRGNASSVELETMEEPSPKSSEVSLSQSSDPPEVRSQQLLKAPNIPANVLLPPLSTRFFGHGLGFPLPTPQLFTFEQAPQLIDSNACKMDNGAAFVNQPLFPFPLPEQFLLPHPLPPLPIVSVPKREENRSGSHVTDPNVHVAHRSSHVTYSAGGLAPNTDPYVTHTNPCTTYPSPHVTPTSFCVTLPSSSVFPANGHAYTGLHAARVLVDMSNIFTK